MKKVIAADPADRIFPIPQKLELSGKNRDLAEASWIILPEDAGFPLKNRIMEIAVGLAAKFVSKPRVSAGKPSAGELLTVMIRKKNIPSEGYQLELKPTGPIEIKASDDAGFFYGMQTAAQLLEDPACVPCCRIEDRPSMKERGYMLDISRNKIPTMDTLKKMVRSLAALRQLIRTSISRHSMSTDSTTSSGKESFRTPAQSAPSSTTITSSRSSHRATISSTSISPPQ